MCYFVYVLRSIRDKTRYVGSTGDVNQRLREHNSGRAHYTRGKKPWELVYKEEFSSRSEAMKREKFFKSGQGRKFLDEHLGVV